MPLMIFYVVQLVYGKSLGLLLVMAYRIKSGLQTLSESFCKRTTSKKGGKELNFPYDRPSPRAELPYGWFALYYLVLIQSKEELTEGTYYAHLCRFENSHWKANYVVVV